MVFNLQKKIKETFAKKILDMTGMDIMENLADTIASFNPTNHFNRFLILAAIALVLAIVILLALKCALVYLRKIIRQIDREKAIFAISLHNLQDN